ncbi:MAG: thioredoxin [Anaerolineaceae bacterium 4572_78]|nr:MAG: thioredoxin [Anaerolineaceae bacterium 4572_78]
MTTSHIINVTDQTFQKKVIEQSYTVPVVVDFWAEWCAPCRMLGPVLEKLATEYNGKFILAKIDVDKNQMMAQQFQIQGIPAVKGFVDGKVFNEFTGAKSEAQVRKFIDSLIPSKADLIAQQGHQWETSNQPDMAIMHYRQAIETDHEHYPAMVALGRVLIRQGNIDEAYAVLEKIPEGIKEYTMAKILKTTVQFQLTAEGHTENELTAKLASHANDVDSRYTYGCLLATQERFAEALEHFLEIVQYDRTYKDDAARKAMLVLFDMLGDDNTLTQKYRRLLASSLF